ncbi:hypothetical protein B0O99DRAFT_171369 [Bisporella sp. PMI_857]|nr:hypothetical protein B0O99DRAFT_171369 [Bisporella sp. PMI_857]
MADSMTAVLARGFGVWSSQAQVANVTASGKNSTATLYLIQDLVFAESKSVRTSTIILASFNILAAFATAASILYDCYCASKRCNPKFRASKFCMSTIHPAETFPLLTAISIVIQGLVFAAVQGTGLTSLFTRGCGLIAQFMWPALFLVPYVQVVFGLECALRSLRGLPFQARGKYDVTICVMTVIIMTIGTWVISFVQPESDRCFASLLWYISAFGFEGLIITSICAGLMIISAITIFIRLSTVNLIDQHQRIAASRMVYYLIVGIVSLGFVIPYFVSQTIGNGDIKAAMMATVVLNLSGLMSGLLHLFLRSNTATTSFGPKGGRSWDLKKHEIRMFGPNELAYGNHLVDPVSGPRSPYEVAAKSLSQTNLIGYAGREKSMESLRSSPPIRSPIQYSPMKANEVVGIQNMPKVTTPIAELPARATNAVQYGHVRKQSYSLFPNGPSGTRQEPTSVYDISDLLPPPDVFGSKSKGHRRDSSCISSATVQIGLRLSAFAISPSEEDIATLPVPISAYNPNSVRPISPLRVQTQNVARPTSPPQAKPSPLNTHVKSPTQTSPISSVNKTLPPTPRNVGFTLPPQRTASPENKSDKLEEPCQLSPAVYSPEKKTVKSPTAWPERSNSQRQAPEGVNKAEWI